MTIVSNTFATNGAPSASAREIANNVIPRKTISLAPAVRDFPAWHFAMLNDEDRNKAIERAIAGLDLQGKIIFEIGTGCGLVALLFAKYGASHVYSCEINPHMAEIARAIIGQSDLANRITLFPAGSSEAIEKRLLPTPPDIIFTETLDCGVVGEGFDLVAQDIRKVSRPGTLVIPGHIQQFGILVEGKAFSRLNRVSLACGFDISVLNAYSTRTYFPVRERLYDYTPLSEPFLLQEYSYTEERRITPKRALAYRSGTAHGVLSWFEAQFGNETITNSPGTHGHWHQAFHPFEETLEVSAKQEVAVTMNTAGQLFPCVGSASGNGC
jgi:type II protein arginine methyltransferase